MLTVERKKNMGLVGNTGITGTSPEPRKPNGGIEMRLNLKPMIVARAAVAPVSGGSALASLSPSADSSVYRSGRASALLTEIQKETAQLGPPADSTFCAKALNGIRGSAIVTTYALRNEENIVEPEIIAVFNVGALLGTQETMRARRRPSRETEPERSDRSTQCFVCSRIYFDQNLSKCPHCNSDSLQHYATSDLDHLAHGGVRESF
jgi:hypothetical protein